MFFLFKATLSANFENGQHINVCSHTFYQYIQEDSPLPFVVISFPRKTTAVHKTMVTSHIPKPNFSAFALACTLNQSR